MENKNVRPNLPAAILSAITNPAEDFQNKVLRPVIKMKSELLIAHLNAKLVALKVNFNHLSKEKQEETLRNIFAKDQSYKREIIGMVIGNFSVKEHETYVPLNTEINKRIVQIVLNRCLDLMVFSL